MIVKGRRSAALKLCIVTLIAAGVRFYNLGGFAFRGDDYSNVESVIGEQIKEPNWPLLFWLERGFCRTVGLNEFTLRLLPALLGIASIPSFYFAGRRTFGELPMLFAGLFISLNHWHVYHSQSTRFYTAVFLFSGMAICFLCRAMTDKAAPTAFWAAVCVLLSAGFHPTGIWPAIAFGAYCMLALPSRRIRASLTGPVLLCFFGPLVAAGASVYATAIMGTTTFIAHMGSVWYGPVHMLLGWIRGIELPIVTVGAFWALGSVLRRNAVAQLELLIGFLPIIALTALCTRTPARPDYAFAAAPILFFWAGGAAAAMLTSTVDVWIRTGVICAFCAALLPSTISHHCENITCDYSLAFRYLKENVQPGDKVYHVFMPFTSYYTGLSASYFSDDPVTLGQQLDDIETSDGTSWLLFLGNRDGLLVDPKLSEWLIQHATLVKRFDARRFDYEVKSLNIYRVAPRTG